jgi:glycogen operon protein
MMTALLICAGLLFTVAIPARASINPNNLGASYNSGRTQITFRVYSANATYIKLYLYSAGHGVQESLTYALSKGNNVWQVVVPVSSISGAGISGSVYYGYRAWGPNWTYSSSWTKGSSTGFVSDVDSNGNRFNPNKLLIDPYAREISQDPLKANNQNADIFASGGMVDGSFNQAYRLIDSGTYSPKGIVLATSTQSTGTKPTRAQKDDVTYEVNVRGLTKQDSSIATQYQGTYYGAGQKASYLASLGVTAVEFLPMQETQNDENDVTPDSTSEQNYWGYMTEDFFAPDRRYASNSAPYERRHWTRPLR